jgi:(R,R)-butanediol dehydrogenase/meso-butanediol dehydrogenase/diacetyl reductase
MEAIRWHGNRDVRLEEVELELELGPGMIEAEVSWCGICGSDIAEFAHGPYAIRERPHVLSGQAPPITLGHEFSGRITAVNGSVGELAVGDRVSADACWRCGTCDACRSGVYNQCPSSGSIGLCSDGAMARRVRFPAYAAVPLPDAVSERAGALLEPLAVGLHALDRGSARAGDPVIVLGFGAIGASSALVGRAIGCDVLVSEPNALRRERAATLGFAVDDAAGEPREAARRLRARTGGGARVVIDATGVGAVLAGAAELTRRGGTIVLVGIPKQPVTIDAGRLVLYERAIVASLGYVNDLPRVARLIASGALDAEPLITRTIALAEVPAELARLADATSDDVKVLVEIGGSG